MIDRIELATGTAVLLLILLLAEHLAPLRRRGWPQVRRLLINAALSALTFLVAAVVVRPAALAALQWTGERPFGLLHVVPLPISMQFVVSFLLLDLTFYWWHVANHRVPLLWRFHNVHHIDPDLDASTAFRFHYGEVALSAFFRVAQVVVIGPSAAMFGAYEVLFQANTLFHHSNLRLPIAVERALNVVLVTPRMHGIHHSQVREETHSNYSVVFSWWDRLHRSAVLDVPQTSIVIGVPAYSDVADNEIWRSAMLPFQRQREYWRGRDGAIVKRGSPPRRSRWGRLAD